MSPITIGLLALGMSVDAFAASVGQGATVQKRGFQAVLATGATFGIIEALTPLIGWALGLVASYYVAAVDHWIAFGLLLAVGLHTIIQALRGGEEPVVTAKKSWIALVVTAIGTSLDAMAVGVSLAFVDVPIVLVAAVIGLTTMVMTMLGMSIGRSLGRRFGRIIEVSGGLVLIAVGVTKLIEHLSA